MASEADLRRIVRSLPETSEKPSYGTPGFRVKDKLFLRLRGEPDHGLVVFVADLGEREALLASDSEKFFTTPHYDGHPSVLVRLPAVGVDELRELVTDAWLVRAPKQLRERYEAELGGDD